LANRINWNMPLMRASFVPVHQCVSDRPVWDNETLRCCPTRWPTRFLPKCCDNAFLRSAPISYGTLIKLYMTSATFEHIIKTILRRFLTTKIRLLVFIFPFTLIHNTKTGLELISWACDRKSPTLKNYERSGIVQ